MHIPDGFLDVKTAVAAGALAATGLGVALRQARRHLPPRRIPLLGLAAAFVFTAQMINFPVAGGTSGHLVGAVLVAVLLGPSAAIVVISAVLVVQCLVFADGGISALGANILNMAIIGGAAGWAIYYGVSGVVKGLFGRILAAAFAAWCSAVLAAVACAGELAASRTVPFSVALPAMGGIHMLIGLGEGAITALVLAAISRARPELLAPGPVSDSAKPYGALVAYGSVIALGLALFVSPFASRWPDGLERVAEVLGFKARAAAPLLAAPMQEYRIPGLGWGSLATSLAGVAGAILVFALSWWLARLLVPKGGRPETGGPGVGD
jgi:cobalt/nickel transport system permease protein